MHPSINPSICLYLYICLFLSPFNNFKNQVEKIRFFNNCPIDNMVNYNSIFKKSNVDKSVYWVVMSVTKFLI
jgi:hypothetical protein